MNARVTVVGIVTITAGLLWLALTTAAAGQERAVIDATEKWSDVFGGAKVKFHYSVRASDPLQGRVGWRWAVKNRTLAEGELPMKLAATQATDIGLPLRVPEIKDGIVLETRLNIALYADGERKPLAEHSKVIWVFPQRPFVNRELWLQRLKISLFDPTGKTAAVLEKAQVPFTLVKSVDALDGNDGLLIIAEGTSWKEHPGLSETMVRSSAKGVSVLCLAPGEGAMVLPGTEGANMLSPDGLTMRRTDVIADLDKRLDAVSWPPEGRIEVTRLAVRSEWRQVVVETTPSTRGWSWLEMNYPKTKGRLLVCGFGIIDKWEATPAARFLLAELLMRMTPEPQAAITKQDARKFQ